MQVVEKMVEGLQLQIVEQIVETPETQTIQGVRTSESVGTAPVCQVTQAENGEVIEIGAPIPAEFRFTQFVTAPVLENYPVVVGSVQPALVVEHVESSTHGHIRSFARDIRSSRSDLPTIVRPCMSSLSLCTSPMEASLLSMCSLLRH